MNVSVQAGGMLSFIQMNSGLKSTQEKVQRQQKCASQVDFFEKQKDNLKNMECSSLEDIARKLEMFHPYEDQIAAAKQQYNNSQMMHILDEAEEIGEKIAEEAEKTAPKTEEERREDRIEEACGTEEESKGMLTEIMDEITEVMEEVEEELEEELNQELQENQNEEMDKLQEGLENETDAGLQGSLEEELNQGLQAGLEYELNQELQENQEDRTAASLQGSLNQGLQENQEDRTEESLKDGTAASLQKGPGKAESGLEERLVKRQDDGQTMSADTSQHSKETIAEAAENRIAEERMKRKAEAAEREAVRHMMFFETEDLKNYRHIDYRL